MLTKTQLQDYIKQGQDEELEELKMEKEFYKKYLNIKQKQQGDKNNENQRTNTK